MSYPVTDSDYPVVESGMEFKAVPEDSFYIEKSALYKNFDLLKVKTVEFIWLKQPNTLLFIEAKSSFSRSDETNNFKSKKRALCQRVLCSIEDFKAEENDMDFNKRIDNFEKDVKKICGKFENSTYNFIKNIEEICEKITNSVDLLLAVWLGRLVDKDNEIPSAIKNIPIKDIEIKLVFIINSHGRIWLTPMESTFIESMLRKNLKRQIKAWGLKITVINEDTAHERGFINQVVN